MAKTRTIYKCQACGNAQPQWAGQCPSCEQWNTLVEEADGPRSARGATYAGPAAKAVRLTSVDASGARARPTYVTELDRVLGGGLVPGSVTLLGGEPGVGKSTLTLQVLASYAMTGRRGLLVSAEESPEQVQ